jgi:hypothetical protein
MTIRSPPRLITMGICALVIVLLYFFLTTQGAHFEIVKLSGNSNPASWSFSGSDKEEKPYGSNYAGHSTPADINRVTNGTLGFSKVLVIGLPERSDKRDAITLTSSLTGFHVEWIDGVRGETVVDKAVPFGVDRKELWETNLGSWRGHMNAVRK